MKRSQPYRNLGEAFWEAALTGNELCVFEELSKRLCVWAGGERLEQIDSQCPDLIGLVHHSQKFGLFLNIV